MINILMEVFGALTIRIGAMDKRRRVKSDYCNESCCQFLDETSRCKQSLFHRSISQDRAVGKSASWCERDRFVKALGITRKS